MALFTVPAGPVPREADGLRADPVNAELSPDERRAAPALFRALLAGQLLFGLGEKDAKTIVSMVVKALSAEPALAVEAVGLADAATGQALRKVDRPALLAAAVKVGAHRLVDAVRLGDA
ncbi:MAG TPA: pantoate--beta-alanine ligase [Thermoanaerobaculia bacterium]|nr:pantoate--beta-alanine ligase [Thermoanaerobaculia bacterium]HQR66017.1 pantoate--beta-alanine ligase [Thermoanaerobaculia bacterium]